MKRKRGKKNTSTLLIIIGILAVVAIVLIIIASSQKVMYSPITKDDCATNAPKLVSYYQFNEDTTDFLGDHDGTLMTEEGCTGNINSCEDLNEIVCLDSADYGCIWTDPPTAGCHPNMLAYWKLDEGEGTEVSDRVGNYDLSEGDTTVYNANWIGEEFCKLGNCMRGVIDELTFISYWPELNGPKHLDGQGNRVEDLISSGYFPQVEGTLEFWIWSDDYSKEIGIFDEVDDTRNHILIRTGTFGENNFQVALKKVDETGYLAQFQAALDNGWHHVALTWNTDTDKVRLFINGVQHGTTKDIPGWKPTHQRFALGKFRTYGGDDSKIRFDEVALYDTVLSAPKIKEHYDNSILGIDYCNEGAGEAGGCSGAINKACTDFTTEATCLSDLGCSFIIYSDIWASGKLGKALNLNVDNGIFYVDVPSLYGDEVDFPKDYGSLALWLRSDGEFSIDNTPLFDKGESGRDHMYIRTYDDADKQLQIGIQGDDMSISEKFDSSLISDDKWHFVVATWNTVGPVETFLVYIDAVQKTKFAPPSGWKMSEQKFTIGTPIKRDGNTRIDEVALFKKVLSNEEILKYYNNREGLNYCSGEEVCIPDIVTNVEDCNTSDNKLTWYEIIEDCGQDMSAYVNTTEDCDYDDLGIIGEADEIELENIDEVQINIDDDEIDYDKDYTSEGKLDVEILDDDDNKILEFEYDFEDGPLNLRNIVIERQSSSSRRGTLLVKGLVGVDKIFYVDKVDEDSEEVCLVDKEEIDQIGDISSDCDEDDEGEVLLECPGDEDDYDCELDADEDYFIISSLENSAVKEMLSAGGCYEEFDCTSWGSCQSNGYQDRTCSCDCSSDDDCYYPDEWELERPCTIPPPCSEPWACDAWGDCEDGWQYRTCDCDCDDSSDCYGDHEESRECGDTTWVWILISIVLIILIAVVVFFIFSEMKKRKKGKGGPPSMMGGPRRPGIPPRPIMPIRRPPMLRR